jgi:hypothetical protein
MGFINHHRITGLEAVGRRPEPNQFDTDSGTKGAMLTFLTAAILAATVLPLG